MSARVCVSIVSYNGSHVITACVESVFAQNYKDISVVVYDNASQDSTRDVIATYPNIRLVESSKNTGFAYGHNEVIRMSDAEYILILNQDAILAPDYIDTCLEFLEKQVNYSSATGRIYKVRDLTNIKKTGIVDTCGLAIKRNHYIGAIGGSSAFPDALEGICPIFGVPGTIGLYRMSALDDVAFCRNGRKEYFDEDFFMYKEDCDLAYRLQWRGWSAATVPKAHAFHVGSTQPALLKRDNAKINSWSYRNQLILLVKNVSPGIAWACWYRIAWYEFGKLVYTAFAETRNLSAWWNLFRQRKSILEKRRMIMKNRRITDQEMLLRFR